MPCESCHGQFTMFSRKHICGKCKRHFCGGCLKGSRKATICELCQIFSSRPLLRDKLMNVRTKDLIFYLQSEHIPIIGCVEKEDLINLILQHAQDIDNNARTGTGTSTSANYKSAQSPMNETLNNTPLEAIRQTCHNFFSNLTENMSDLYTKSRNEKSRPVITVNQQPRISVREMPAYSDNQMVNIMEKTTCKSNTRIHTVERRDDNGNGNGNGNGNFNADNHKNSQIIVPSDDSNQIITASTSTGSTYTRLASSRSKLNIVCDKNGDNDNDDLDNDDYDDESILTSSNELGAIGGVLNNNNNIDHNDNGDDIAISTNITKCIKGLTIDGHSETAITTSNDAVEDKRRLMETQLPSHSKTLTRRHSENLNLCNYIKNSSIETKTTLQNLHELMTISKTCSRCANNKTNIRQQIEKMRKHLESAHMSEIDIKQELSKFLSFLEQRTKSFEYSHSESDISSVASEQLALNDNMCFYPPYNANVNDHHRTTRFVNLYHFESTQELKKLTVKELKKILMLNRVDFAGCCEKSELLDRVEILWKNLKSTPTVDKLPSSDLCKVCMDAPIECVILECGHMATCTNCGKVLCECPICRQYIVRVVRFFRA